MRSEAQETVKLALVCGRAVISRCEQNVGMHVDNK